MLYDTIWIVALVARSRASDGRMAGAVEAGSVAGRAPEALEAAAPNVMVAARSGRSAAAAKREVRRLGGNPSCGALIPC
jgi:hypothetical protein